MNANRCTREPRSAASPVSRSVIIYCCRCRRCHRSHFSTLCRPARSSPAPKNRRPSLPARVIDGMHGTHDIFAHQFSHAMRNQIKSHGNEANGERLRENAEKGSAHKVRPSIARNKSEIVRAALSLALTMSINKRSSKKVENRNRFLRFLRR